MSEIPVMTHPMSRHWRQPSRESILVDDTHAAMDRQTFNALSEYSLTIPPGVYDGKMWKAQSGLKWLLCWYGPDPNPDRCSINTRFILIVEVNMGRK